MGRPLAPPLTSEGTIEEVAGDIACLTLQSPLTIRGVDNRSDRTGRDNKRRLHGGVSMEAACVACTPGAIRTHNLSFRRASLCPFELPGHAPDYSTGKGIKRFHHSGRSGAPAHPPRAPSPVPEPVRGHSRPSRFGRWHRSQESGRIQHSLAASLPPQQHRQ